jgi:GTP diphosphokinase / guanosine-3',5'-bis(diphosphate) 3'-diphosphatase
LREPPPFITESELLVDAYELACWAHEGDASQGDTEIGHPLAVAELLDAEGFDNQVVAAALLHDVVEDTAVDLDSISERFGPGISELVAEMTEDESIESYPQRKAEHRERVSRDRRAAAIYAADKLASARTLDAADAPGEKLEHYRATLRKLREEHPDLPFLEELESELAAIDEGK